MRGIVLALLLTLAVSQKFPHKGQLPETGGESPELRLDFINGKLYQYKYEGIIRNTAQGEGLGQSAVRLTSDISIYGGERDNTLMFLSPQMEEFVGFPIEPRDQFAESKDQFTEPPKKPGKLDACTLYAYHFEYNNGRIENIRVSTQVPLYCLNMVRGILNMLIATPRNQKEYELQEDGIDGECQTRYVIVDDKSNNGVIMTRTKDLNNCRNKVKRTIGMSYFYLNPRCLLRNTMVQGTSAFVMKLRFEGPDCKIAQVESEEVYQVSPFSEADGTGVMTAWQKLTLMDVKTEHAAKQHPQAPAEEKTVDIHYEFPENLPQMVLIEDAKRQIVEILQEVDGLPGIPLEVVPKYIELSQLFRRLSVEEMNTIYNDFGSRPRARQFLLTGMAYAGTLNCMKFIKDKLVKGELHNMEPYWVVPITLHFANPAVAKMEDTARVAAEILNQVSSSGSFWLQKLSFLGHGSLVYKQCSQARPCSNKLLEPLHNLLTDAVSHHDENRIMLALKSLGNAAQPASLKIVRPLAENDKYTKFIQAVAIQTLMQIGKQDPAKVQGILIQIYLNASNSVQVRIMSCIAIFQTYPALPMVAAIANAAFREKNLILYSFVYSQLKAWTKNRIPAYYELSSVCNVALKLLNPRFVRLNEHYSKVVHLNFFSSIHRVGAIAKLFVIDNPRGPFPSNVMLNTELIFSGTIVKPFEVTLQVEGLREWLRKLNVPLDQYSGDQKIKDTERKLPGFKDIPLERSLLAANLKILNQEVVFFTPEETKQLRKLGEGKLLGPQALGMIYQIIKNIDQQITQALILEARHMVPTTLGLPFEVSAAGIAMVHSSLKAVKNDEGQKTVREELQLESHVVFQGYGRLFWGVNTGFSQHIVEITGQFRTQGSLKMNATWDMKARNFKVEIDPIHEEYELAVASHEAHVVALHLHSEKKAPVLPERLGEDILTEEFKPRDDNVKQSRSSYKSNPSDVCFTFHIYPVKVCLETVKKTKDVMPIRRTWMHFLCEAHEVRILLTPVVAMEKIKGEIQQVLVSPRMKREVKRQGGKDECRDFPIPPEGQEVPCTLEYVPVCASDGVTYPNKCSFCKAKRQSENQITIEHEGECEQEGGITPTKRPSKPDRDENSDSSIDSSSSSDSSEPATKPRKGRKQDDSSSDTKSSSDSSDTSSSDSKRSNRHRSRDSSSSSSSSDKSSSSDSSDKSSSSDSSDKSSSSSDSSDSSDKSSSSSDSSDKKRSSSSSDSSDKSSSSSDSSDKRSSSSSSSDSSDKSSSDSSDKSSSDKSSSSSSSDSSDKRSSSSDSSDKSSSSSDSSDKSSSSSSDSSDKSSSSSNKRSSSSSDSSDKSSSSSDSSDKSSSSSDSSDKSSSSSDSSDSSDKRSSSSSDSSNKRRSSSSSSSDSSDKRSSSSSDSSDKSSSSSDSSDKSSSSSSDSSDKSSSSSDKSSSSSDKSSSSSSDKSSSSSDKSSSSSDSSDSSSSESSSSSDDSSSDSRKSSSSSSDSSDSNSDSSSSSESHEGSRKKGGRQEIYQFSFRSIKQQGSKQQRNQKQQSSSQDSDDSSSSSIPDLSSSSEDNIDYSDRKWVQVLIAHLRIIRRDKKPHGVDALVYKTSSRFRMTVTNLTRPGKPIVCLESGMLSPYKAMSSLKTGWDCKEYEISTEVETGWLSVHPAIRWKVNYPRVPEVLITIWEPIYSRIPGVAYMLGLSHKIQKNPSREASLVLALTAQRSFAMVLRMPEYTVYGEDLMLPFVVPLRPSLRSSKLSDVPLRILASLNGVCRVNNQTITTFNTRTISKGLVPDCFLDLLQDCTCHKKFMMLMKYESHNNNYILLNITVVNTEIVFMSRDNKLIATLNGTVISGNEDRLRRLKDIEMIDIIIKEDEFILLAQPLGLEKLVYDGHNIMITVTPEIGIACGLCEVYGGQLGNLRTPSGYLAKDLVSFAQSWVVPDESGETCKLQHSTVRHESPVLIAEENSQCVSSHPVLQCQEGCSPTQTTDISAGFHCVSAGTTLPTELTKLAEKSEDFVDTVQSHVACSCAQ